jgi:hypothetical protein
VCVFSDWTEPTRQVNKSSVGGKGRFRLLPNTLNNSVGRPSQETIPRAWDIAQTERNFSVEGDRNNYLGLAMRLFFPTEHKCEARRLEA